ncbi:hypothetical protein E4U50_004736 [Claviceps purpurea]|nr:hypothetical protein E4U50_004736 [Claviceps purpurea]
MLDYIQEGLYNRSADGSTDEDHFLRVHDEDPSSKEGPATHSSEEKPFDDVAFTFKAHWQPHCQVLSLLPARDPSKEKAATNLIDKPSSSHRTSARKPLALCQSRFTVPSASCTDPRDKEDLSDEGLSADAPGEEARPKDPILAVFVVSVVGPSP